MPRACTALHRTALHRTVRPGPIVPTSSHSGPNWMELKIIHHGGGRPGDGCTQPPWAARRTRRTIWPWNECLTPPPSLDQRRLAALWHVFQRDRCGQRQMWSTTTGGQSGTVSLLDAARVWYVNSRGRQTPLFFSCIEIRKIVHLKAKLLNTFKSLTTPTSIDWWLEVNICFRQLWVISCHGGCMGALWVQRARARVCVRARRLAVNLVVFDRPCLQTPNLCFTTLACCYKLGSKPEPNRC